MIQDTQSRFGGPAPRLALVALASALLAGCGGGSKQQAALESARQELDRLQEESRERQKLIAENRELPRLRKDNQELPNLRGHDEEIARLRLENEQLRGQIAAGSKQRNPSTAGGSQMAAPGAAVAFPAGQGTKGDGQPSPAQVATEDPNVPLEGDQILIEPGLLGKLLPEFDWSKIERKEPVVVNDLLAQKGITLTNYQQLIALGVTNYKVVRGVAKPQTETQK